jgi:DsbC/DsbD-like thiol-disulfide interchange protein
LKQSAIDLDIAKAKSGIMRRLRNFTTGLISMEKPTDLHRRAANLCGAILLGAIFTIACASAGTTARAATKASAVSVKSGDVQATITLPVGTAVGGQKLPLRINFAIAPGWHIYGRPLPQDYQPTTIEFDKTLLASQSIDFPKPTPVNFKVLGQTLPVYEGNFKVPGSLVLKRDISPGEHKLAGTLSFQECNDQVCKMPRTVHFELPITVMASSR